MFKTGPVTIAKRGKQPKYALTEEWIKKTWYIYTLGYYSAIKENEIVPFAATRVNPEMVILSEVRKDNYHLYVESKNGTKNFFTKQCHSYRKQT